MANTPDRITPDSVDVSPVADPVSPKPTQTKNEGLGGLGLAAPVIKDLESRGVTREVLVGKSVEDLKLIDGIGEKSAEAIYKALNTKEAPVVAKSEKKMQVEEVNFDPEGGADNDTKPVGLGVEHFDQSKKALMAEYAKEPMVRMFIPRADNEPKNATLTVQVNGVIRYNAPKGTYFNVPESIAKIIAESLNTTANVGRDLRPESHYKGSDAVKALTE